MLVPLYCSVEGSHEPRSPQRSTAMAMATACVSINGYRFVKMAVEYRTDLRAALQRRCNALELRGCILLAEEGINISVAGGREAVETFKEYIWSLAPFQGLVFKESVSDEREPFTRMNVRMRQEIIPFGSVDVRPYEHEGPEYLEPHTLHEWLTENRDVVLLDTRNNYEIRLGTFRGAIDLNINQFSQFPQASIPIIDDLVRSEKPIVTFCTGGIRCEKAGRFLQQMGCKQVYQLKDGILNYFKDVGGEFYDGECYVFDKRVAVDHLLRETSTEQCFGCRNPLTVEQQQHPRCCYCGHHLDLRRHASDQSDNRAALNTPDSITAESFPPNCIQQNIVDEEEVHPL